MNVSVRNPIALLQIINLDGPARGSVGVTAQYNPKEVQVENGIKWDDHPAKDGSLGLEFGSKSARTMSIELLFDDAEDNGRTNAVSRQLEKLHELTENIGKERQNQHPPRVTVLWGDRADSLPRFPAVIESISVKYQMFSTTGRVLRATATVKLKEAGTLGVKKKSR